MAASFRRTSAFQGTMGPTSFRTRRRIGESRLAASIIPIRPPIEVPTQSILGPSLAPWSRRSSEPGEQRRRVRKILRKTVVLLVLEPVALAAADDVHARDAAAALRETRRELVEVPAVARQAVHAHH